MAACRIIVRGQDAMFMRNFEPHPNIGDVFQMASGEWFRVETLAHSPVGFNPDWLIGASPVGNVFPWEEGASEWFYTRPDAD